MYFTKKKFFTQKPEQQKKVGLSSRNTFIESFNFRIGTTIVDSADPTLAWQYQVPIMLIGQKNVLLKTEIFQVALFGFVGNDFPNRISIACDNVNGFSNTFGIPTNKILVLELTTINNRNESGIQSRDLIYQSQIENTWQLGNLRDLKFRIFVDDDTNPIQLPTLSDIGISIKIIHVAV